MILQQRFADRLREAMEIEGVSQSELARRMGVTPALVWQYVNKNRSPGFDMVEKFAEALRIPDPVQLMSAEKLIANACRD